MFAPKTGNTSALAAAHRQPTAFSPQNKKGDFVDGRPDAIRQRRMAGLIGASSRMQRQSNLQSAMGAGVLQRVRGPVVTKKDQIIASGYTAEQAEKLKDVMEGWVAAKEVAIDKSASVEFVKKVLHDYPGAPNRGLCQRILRQLNEHSYNLMKIFASLIPHAIPALVNKGLNTAAVDAMTGYPLPAARAIILSLHDNVHIGNISYLGRIFRRFPHFIQQVDAQKAANGAAVQTVINYLATLNGASISYLQNNRPAFNVLEVMAAQPIDANLMSLLPEFGKEANVPGNDTYEPIGNQGKSYRIGHFARYHTLRGIQNHQNMGDEGKTIFAPDTTVANIRTACQEFDASRVLPATFPHSYDYTPPTINTGIRIFNNRNANQFDQMYPRRGTTIYTSWVTKLSRVTALKNDWR